jgi:hypothetical protein
MTAPETVPEQGSGLALSPHDRLGRAPYRLVCAASFLDDSVDHGKRDPWAPPVSRLAIFDCARGWLFDRSNRPAEHLLGDRCR